MGWIPTTLRPGSVVAAGYRYPTPTSHGVLSEAVAELDGPIGKHMRRFVVAVGQLELGKWEELHTRTLDLSPLFIPYVGYVLWGENYRRGEFMADLKRDMERLGVELHGELPDHLDPVLRYLDATPSPLSDLMADLPKAIGIMRSTLKKAESANPYRHLLAATAEVVGQSEAADSQNETGAPR